MVDLTLLYCTANVIPDITAKKIRQNLLEVTQAKFPTISVSQKPIDFGTNICVGEIGKSCYNFFKQILLGALKVKTDYITHIDDDTLYVAEHFEHRPSGLDTFTWNTNAWIGGDKLFWHPKEELSGMFCHISPTKALIENLSARFKMYPTKPRDDHHWGEPGKFDIEFGIPNAKVEKFSTKFPLISFEYRGSLNGKRKRFGPLDPDNQTDYLEPYGSAISLRKKYWDESPVRNQS
ncbi:MAG: hypothetical protein UT24_C0007G0070 [Candidatus Woesebacteria bacterium GW2011_GWB1_39_12]|uniref:Nucleotide-diphospho-sugar transferase domain-containing protein n=2 Tax=Candidatus Woeseibacteriota TaxID=1752722 RepID=A0A0G0M288_9BACT|nr:MAG: hypothetical protein UT23_C0004G0149 [Candidatus Woesebacteria bacterium GW2011_GWA1_39_12]KKR01106.1 MAG: hypothetical protein UT24_C0007G0070 [Candidatus Woesebacteria bacterium GW2011_GWB1_39_12]